MSYNSEIEKKVQLESAERIWKVDLLLLLIKTLRSFRQKYPDENNLEVYCDLSKEWKKKIDNHFDFNFNHFLTSLNSKVYFHLPENSEKSFYIFNLEPFGILKIPKSEVKLKNEFEKKLTYFNSEYERAWKLLNNKNFLEKAPNELIEKERKKLDYFAEQKNKILQHLNNNLKK